MTNFMANRAGFARPPGLGFRDPIPQTEVGAYFPALVPALLNFRAARIREAERILVAADGVDHRVGFHKDVFPFGFVCSSLDQA